ncbi:MAG: M3 family oligoendopeptidase [Oscillospiraceae bacterium]|nr:M3 family oligoendopeptidase [Oscillospiraceae bacterium]
MEKFSSMEYRRPDFAACRKRLAQITKKVKAAGSYADYRAAYIEAEKVITEVYTMSSLCEIRNTMDKTDSFYEAEQKAVSSGNAKMSLSLQKLMKAAVASPLRKQFDEEFGPQLMKSFEMELKLISFRIIPDMIKEDRLSQKYSKDAALCKCDFRGEECNFYGLLKHMESTDRDERAEAFRAWAALYEGVSEKLDKTYDKLVALRVRKAKKLGFSNFIDYIYPARGRFDYTAADVERFRAKVWEVIVPFCAELYKEQAARLGVDAMHWYDEALVFPEGNAVPEGSMPELVEKAGEMYAEMSPETGEFFRFMREYELFDLETRPGKHLGGYCTFLPDYKAPFIFSNFNGTSADVDVLTHEAGHAFECYTASRTLPLANQISSTSEINEIHSMSMEHFAYPWMESFFGEKADKYRFAHLCSAVETIPYLVSVDEFQHRVFENPGMTAADRRRVWREIEQTYLPWRDYDGNEFLSNGGFWMQKQHIFLYPFYYVDYALAQICAFQFFLRMREDRESAWNDYLKLCKAGGSKGYFELLEYAGLDNPFAEGTVEKVIEGVKEAVAEFRAKI